MKTRALWIWLALAMAPSITFGAVSSIGALKWRHRIVLVASPRRDDARVMAQRKILEAWKTQAADRDVISVEIAGRQVTGVSDTAQALRQRYGLGPDAFQVLLIGKDGDVALRSDAPIPAATLQAAIDAMPMRRAGER